MRGLIIDKLRKELYPRELKRISDRCFIAEVVRDFLEYSMLRSWMGEWLLYLKWYWQIAMSPDVTIDQLFSGPTIMYDWKMTRKDEQLVRFALFWKMYDLVSEIGLNPGIPGFSGNPISGLSDWWILRNKVSGPAQWVSSAQSWGWVYWTC